MSHCHPSQSHLNLVIVGHVDHGKSTLVGRMLADLNVLPDGKLEQIKNYCANNAKPFEYAFILDALKEERRQGITIDVSRIFFRSETRSYMILDAPGHEEFIKNMVTGAAHADVAILLVDAKEGLRENTQRHILMLSLLGTENVVVVINKLDLVDYNESTFFRLKDQVTRMLEGQGLKADRIIPASAYNGENLAQTSSKMPWYRGETLFGYLEALNAEPKIHKNSFRFQVQDVYKFTENQDTRRIIAGPLLSGSLEVGAEIQFWPSKQKATVRSIESFPLEAIGKVDGPQQVGITLKQDLFIKRGEMATLAGDLTLQEGKLIRARFFWLGKTPLKKGDSIGLKINSQKTEAKVLEIHSTVSSSKLEEKRTATQIETLEVGECTLELKDPVVFDKDNTELDTNRFVFVREFQIVGGGKLLDAMESVACPQLGSVLYQPVTEILKKESKELSVWYFKPAEVKEMLKLESDFKRSFWKVASLDFANNKVSAEIQNCLIKTLHDLGYTLLVLKSDEGD